MTRELRNQMLAIVAPIMISGTVMIGSATWYLATTIEDVRASTIQIAGSLTARVAVTETRIDHIEKQQYENNSDERSFRNEIRAALLKNVGHP